MASWVHPLHPSLLHTLIMFHPLSFLATLHQLQLLQVWCRQDNNLHMGPTYSAQFQELESAIKVSPNMTFFYPIKLKNYTGRIESGFSEVLRTSLYPSQKIQLILTILTVVSLFSYLFWGTRNGSCHFLCLHALSWDSLDISRRIRMICR